MSVWQELVQRANKNPQFLEQLRSDPTGVCRKAGCDVPAGTTVEIVEDAPDCLHLFLGTRTKDERINALLAKAEADSSFGESLIANPKAVVESALGTSMPNGARVLVHEANAQRIRLLLAPEKAANEELSDQQLELVAGGGFFANVRDAVGDFFCRDQPVAIDYTTSDGRTRLFIGAVTTRSGNFEGSGQGVVTTD